MQKAAEPDSTPFVAAHLEIEAKEEKKTFF